MQDKNSFLYNTVKLFEKGSANQNQYGNHLWTPELAEMYGAEKGKEFMGRDANGNPALYNYARYNDPTVGEQASNYIVDKIWENTNKDSVAFAKQYTGLPEDDPTVQNYAGEINRSKKAQEFEGAVERLNNSNEIKKHKSDLIADVPKAESIVNKGIKDGRSTYPEIKQAIAKMVESNPELISESKKLAEETANSLDYGLSAFGVSMAEGMLWLNQATGSNLSDERVAKIESSRLKTKKAMEENLHPMMEKDFEASDFLDPHFYSTTIASQIPTQLALMSTGLGVAKWFGRAGGIWGSIKGAVTGALAMRPMESAMEAGQTYQQLIDAGVDKNRAGEEASGVFKKNMTLIGLDAGQIALAMAGVKPGVRKPLAKFIRGLGVIGTGAVTEGGEELVQNFFHDQGIASGLGEADPDFMDALLLSTPEQKKSFAIGALFGGAFSAVGQLTRDKVTQEQVNGVLEEEVEKYQTLKQAKDAQVEEATTDEQGEYKRRVGLLTKFKDKIGLGFSDKLIQDVFTEEKLIEAGYNPSEFSRSIIKEGDDNYVNDGVNRYNVTIQATNYKNEDGTRRVLLSPEATTANFLEDVTEAIHAKLPEVNPRLKEDINEWVTAVEEESQNRGESLPFSGRELFSKSLLRSLGYDVALPDYTVMPDYLLDAVKAEMGLDDGTNLIDDMEILGEQAEPTEAIDLPPNDAKIKEIAKSIAQGKEFTDPESLQFYRNNAKAVEAELERLTQEEIEWNRPSDSQRQEDAVERTRAKWEAEGLDKKRIEEVLGSTEKDASTDVTQLSLEGTGFAMTPKKGYVDSAVAFNRLRRGNKSILKAGERWNEKTFKKVVRRLKRMTKKDVSSVFDLDGDLSSIDISPRRWYRGDIDATLSNVSKIRDDVYDKESFFITALGILSNGQPVATNYKQAIRLFEETDNDKVPFTWYEKYHPKHDKWSKYWGLGKLKGEESPFGGVRGENVSKQGKLLQKIIDQYGIENLDQFLLGEFTGQELKDAYPGTASHISTKADKKAIHYGAEVFGRKIGAYITNMHGIHEDAVLDVWMYRTFVRQTGAEKQLSDSYGVNEFRAHKQAIKEVADELAKSTGIPWGVDQVQAVLWYNEKELYIQEGVKPERGESYAEISEKDAKIRGRRNVTPSQDSKDVSTDEGRRNVNARKSGQSSISNEKGASNSRRVGGKTATHKVRSLGDARSLRRLKPSQALAFRKAISKAKLHNRFGSSVYVYGLKEYKDMAMFMSRNGAIGYAIKDGEIVSVFHNKSIDSNPYVLDVLIPHAIDNGGTKLEAFDTVLPRLYSEYGFVETSRVPWNDDFAPRRWDKELYKEYNKGEPDVVHMELGSSEENFSLSPKEVMKNPAFRKWFKRSKVVDENGDPLVVYHGSLTSFKQFSPDVPFGKRTIGGKMLSSAVKDAFFFTDDPAVASDYTSTTHLGKSIYKTRTEARKYRDTTFSTENVITLADGSVYTGLKSNLTSSEKGGQVYPVYISMQNPAIILGQGRRWGQVQNELEKLLKSGKHDGVIIRDIKDPYTDVVPSDKIPIADTYVATKPNQIKSVFNLGKFDPSNPDIGFSLSPHSEKELAKEFGRKVTLRERRLAKKAERITKSKQARDVIKSFSSQVNRINPLITEDIKKFQLGTWKILEEYNETAVPLAMSLKNLKDKARGRKKKANYTALKLALLNGDSVSIKNLLSDKVFKQYQEWRITHEKMHEKALAVGIDLGHLDDHFPRQIVDYDAYLKYVHGITSGSKKGDLSEAIAIAEADRGRALTKEEQVDIANYLMREVKGLNSVQFSDWTKARKVDIIELEHLRFYADPNVSIINYGAGMSRMVSSAQFLGGRPNRYTLRAIPGKKKSVGVFDNKVGSFYRNGANELIVFSNRKSPKAVKLMEELRQLEQKRSGLPYMSKEDQVGGMIFKLHADHGITKGEEKRLRSLFNDYFNKAGMPTGWNTVRNIGYITTMGSVFSAVTQLADLGVSVYRQGQGKFFGYLRPGTYASVLKEMVSSTFRLNKYKLKDLGLDDTILRELNESDSGLSKLGRVVFKTVGLKKMDQIGKETLINTVMKKYSKQAKMYVKGKNNKHTRMMMARLKRKFKGKELNQLIDDLASGEKTELTQLLAYSELLDVQPVADSELPVGYLRYNDGRRLFYMLKTFALKRLDLFTNEANVLRKEAELLHADGKFIRAKHKRLQAQYRFLTLGMLLVLAEAGADTIKDRMAGRTNHLDDLVISNILKMMMLSRYHYYSFINNPRAEAVLKLLLFPTDWLFDPAKDLIEFGKRLDKHKNSDEMFKRALKDFKKRGSKGIRNIPWFGKHMYWMDMEGDYVKLLDEIAPILAPGYGSRTMKERDKRLKKQNK